MSKPVRARLLFFLGSVAVIIYVQSSLLPLTLTGLIGNDGADRVTENIRENTPVAIFALIVAFYIDIIRRRIDKRDEDEQRAAAFRAYQASIVEVESHVQKLAQSSRAEIFANTEPSELVRLALSREFPAEARRLDALARAMLGGEGAHPILDCTIRHKLSVDPNYPDNVIIERWQSAYWSIDRYIIALTSSFEPNEWLAFACPDVHDNWIVGNKELLEVNTDLQQKYAYIEVIPSADRHSRPIRCRMILLDKADWPTYLGEESSRYEDELRVLTTNIPQTKDPITVYTRCCRSLVDNYLFWAADCPTYIDEISFDVQDMQRAHPSWKFDLVPFMGYAGDMQSVESEGLISSKPRNWLTKGQGAILVWRVV